MIGVFDSGLGGLTVVREIYRQLPDRKVVYFGDTARTPYGTKSAELIKKYAMEDAAMLVDRGAKMLVVACNTVSAHGVDELRQAFGIPVFEVVTPAVAQALAVTKGRVGVIGTRGTVGSGIYERKMKELEPEVEVHSDACPLFVPLVDEGWAETEEAVSIASRYLNPLKLRQIDTLILGCTHYPFLQPVIRKAIGDKVSLVDPARETVRMLSRYLESRPELDAEARTGNDTFFVSDRTDHFARLASEWLGREVDVRIASPELQVTHQL
jgi:glutamate racemase